MHPASFDTLGSIRTFAALATKVSCGPFVSNYTRGGNLISSFNAILTHQMDKAHCDLDTGRHYVAIF